MIDLVIVFYPASRSFVLYRFHLFVVLLLSLLLLGSFPAEKTSATECFSRRERIQQTKDSRTKTSKWKQQEMKYPRRDHEGNFIINKRTKR